MPNFLFRLAEPRHIVVLQLLGTGSSLSSIYPYRVEKTDLAPNRGPTGVQGSAKEGSCDPLKTRNDWRALEDSNLRPMASKASALSG